MRTFHSEFAHAPDNKEMLEKAISARGTTTATIIVACLVAMCLTAYAYFAYSVTSSSNVIKAARFDVQVTIEEATQQNTLSVSEEKGENTQPDASAEVQNQADTGSAENSDDSNGEISSTGEENQTEQPALERYSLPMAGGDPFTVDLSTGKTYKVTVTLTDDSTAATGFLAISYAGMRDDGELHTQQLIKNVEHPVDPIVFTIRIPASTNPKINMTFLPCWGTSKCFGKEDVYAGVYIRPDQTFELPLSSGNS